MLEERKLDKDIEVDGGIYHSNVAEVLKAGANIIVSGSGVYKGNISVYFYLRQKILIRKYK